MKPKISIITPTKNSAATLEASIQSVVTQKGDFYEYILVDGGSVDETLQIIKRYQHVVTRWISEPDNGIYDAMRKGIALARGDYICFLGSDDTLCPDIHRIVSFLRDSRSIYYGNAFLSVTREVYDGPFNKYKITYDNICQQAIFYPESVFKEFRFNERYSVGADYELNLRLFWNSPYTFEYLPFIIAKFSQRGTSAMIVDQNLNADKIQIIRKNAPAGIRVFFYVTHYVPMVRMCSDQILKIFQHFHEMRSKKKYVFRTPPAE
jgi:glycosyltransferase involved in cell wall biosynthesis